MSEALDQARRKRHARIRWRMLFAMHASRHNAHGGWTTGRGLIDTLEWAGTDYQVSDDEAMGLLQDLVTTGYAAEEDNREDTSQTYGLDHLTYKISGKGIAFVNRTVPPDALIDDGRIIK